ncbi:MAG TPA: molybdopterin cofactor-binding domain-containing protein [Croceibacterium sp.]|jgi:isoquinoline 1-oxidoreductase beta subunit
MHVSRRGLLVGGAVGGGLLVAWALWPRQYGAPLPAGATESAFGAWLTIAEDGVVTVAVPQLEMGQGVTTLLPQIVAVELGADWRQVAVEPAPISGAYANFPLAARWAPLWRPGIPFLAQDPDDWLLKRWAQDEAFVATAEGTTLAAYEQPCREAAASARALLCMAAADRWGVRWEECEARAGIVRNGHSALTFGELARAAAKYDAPKTPPLRSQPPAEMAEPFPDPAQLQTAFPRLDLPSKVDGSHLFTADVRLPNMAYAAIRHGPVGVAELARFDTKAAAGTHGLVAVVKAKRWLAAVAETWWAAEQALDRMAPRFRVAGAPDSRRFTRALDHGVRESEPQRVAARGNGDADMDAPTFALRYDVEPSVHGTIETASCTARFDNGRLELWLASQAPERARRAAAKTLGLSLDNVVLYPMPAGGSFDRRLEHDHVIEAALIAREAGRPVQLVWSRLQEQLTLRPRAPVAAVLSCKTSADGYIDTFRARLATPPWALEFGRRLFDNATAWAAMDAVDGDADALALDGLMPAYAIPNVAIDHVPVSVGLPAGRMRGGAHGYTAFMVESFIDEIAHRHEQEPMAFRIAMLGHDVRLAACLQRAAELGNWGGGGGGGGQGIACHRMALGKPGADTGGRIAVVATASGGAGGIDVSQLAVAVDIGRVVNRDIALQQIEGGLLYGLGLALGSATGYRRGLPTAQRLAALRMPTLATCPEITIDLIDSGEAPFDPGEIGVPAVAPAVANAVFASTGVRLRRLPLLTVAA